MIADTRNETAPVLVWFRRDLRLCDHAALTAACATGRPVIPVFIHDDAVAGLGAAPRFRLDLGLRALDAALREKGSRLILRRGGAQEVLRQLIVETGARSVFWTRLYDPASQARDSALKSALKQEGIEARSFAGHLLFEPWTVQTGTGGPYRVFSPMWRAVAGRAVDGLLPPPDRIAAPDDWPGREPLDDWQLQRDMRRGARVVAAHVQAGEAAALDRLDDFCALAMGRYKAERDLPGVDGTSRLSDYLSLGEISPHRCWAAALRAGEAGAAGAETFRKELVWREFAYHLMYHTPHILTDNWRPEWQGFLWNTDGGTAPVTAWKQGRTGVPLVDAAMREMYVTGRMHNRARMIAASYLTKHLLTDWRIGRDWFEQHLTDWDPASNAMGWQWVAGCGPDASPYFRIFNPETQQQKFDPDGAYLCQWIAEGHCDPTPTALSYFDAVPESWALSPEMPYPQPVVGLREGRERALDAYHDWRG